MDAGTSLNVLLFAIGSAGDVHPFVGLGQALARRGHRVTLATGGYFEPLVRAAGLRFVELFTAEHYRDMLRDPDIWHALRGPRTVMRMGIVPMIRRVFEIVAERNEPGQTVVGASSLALGSRVAQEKLGVPTATIHLQPCMFRSNISPPRLPGMLSWSWLPRSVFAAQWWLADRLVVDRLICPELNAFRSELGLLPVRRPFAGWMNSPTLTLGLFPEWFAQPAADWPPQVRLTGFPLYDEHDISSPNADLEAFLNAGSPPIAFTPGSAMTFGHEFFAAAVDACRRLGRRGILLTRHGEQIPSDLPPTVRHFDFVPFSQLLPRAAALVHHGGIGTLSQALAAGIPQLIMPMSHDQFDNAERIARIGVGGSLARSKFRGDRLSMALGPLLHSAKIRETCHTVAAKLAEKTQLDDAAIALENLPAGIAADCK